MTTTPPRQPRRFRTPKRSLGRIALFPSAYQCPWLGRDHLVYATIQADSTTLETDQGDMFEGVGHWVQTEQRRELMRLQMESIIHKMDDECPDTPALFRSQHNQLPTVSEYEDADEETEPDLALQALNALDSLEIEINGEDDDFLYDDDEMEQGVDLEEIDTNDFDVDVHDEEDTNNSLHASMARRWKHINLDDEDDRISPRSVTDVNGDGGGRIMNFDAVKDVEEMEVMEEMDDISNLLLQQHQGSNVYGKGKELLQRSLSSGTISAESSPMVMTGSINITPMEVSYDDDEDQENDDAVAAALKVFKSILNNTISWNSSPEKVGNLSNRTSPILIGAN